MEKQVSGPYCGKSWKHKITDELAAYNFAAELVEDTDVWQD